MSARLQDRTALVTGSTDGIGAAIARALAAEGAYVIVSGRDTARGEKVVAAISERGGRASFVRADLAAGLPAIGELADAAHRLAGGPLDILVNNAAMLITPGPTADVGEDLIDQALTVNVKAAFLLTGLLAPAMAARGSGAIINLGSISGLFGTSGSALYSTTKAAIHSLTKSWAGEYGPAGVRVNTVAPGPTFTDKIAAMRDHLAPMIAALPSRRPSTPEEVAAAVVFLACDDASNIHGATLSVDGGRAAV
ncbi:SDR family NAD(P)-dependent oxidoreductase [Nonomuraea jiangxiensis]|uniref:NAD(P)-dependent dehydrogenase, short-chain alcohol dehydrogenase family n=1 Tax=Nonomuraea jiangxiensis TaxID=633440 RepID=A0A1G8D525_9ACTN|nr:SDR family oxidoreductase [Nonomuraea jiangxiensis]SDH52898.1 NAD(P)-dependent dehydrogenase, short-chain alcohol dehydrogenase family [Nonomuraea jiangxiensis]